MEKKTVLDFEGERFDLRPVMDNCKFCGKRMTHDRLGDVCDDCADGGHMEDLKIIPPRNTIEGKWRVRASSLAANFSSEADARNAAMLCERVYKAGRADKAKEISTALNERQ